MAQREVKQRGGGRELREVEVFLHACAHGDGRGHRARGGLHLGEVLRHPRRQRALHDFAGAEGTIGIGLTQHKLGEGFPAAVITRDPAGRWLSIGEESKDGGVGVAAILAPGMESSGSASEGPDERGNTNHLILVKAADGAPVRYFTGAGWDKSGDFKTSQDWDNYNQQWSQRIQSPLQITISK